MTDDQKDFVVELIRNTIEYLHKQEILLIQLAGSIEASKKDPKPTPAEKIAEEAEKFYKDLKEQDPDYQYPFPWGRKLGKKEDHGPGLTTILANNEPKGGVLLEDLPKGVFTNDPRSLDKMETPIRDAMVNGPGEPPRGARE